MAKVLITLEDAEGGSVKIVADFFPLLAENGDRTPAQGMAERMVKMEMATAKEVIKPLTKWLDGKQV